jgi:flagellar basal body-associated protein FliL
MVKERKGVEGKKERNERKKEKKKKWAQASLGIHNSSQIVVVMINVIGTFFLTYKKEGRKQKKKEKIKK